MDTALDLSMIILAGGESRRMGRNKAELEYMGRTFLQCQIDKGVELGIRDILVSGYCGRSLIHGQGLSHGQATYKNIPDRYPHRGPLGGLEAALREAAHPQCLVLSIDVPLVPACELRELVKAHGKGNQPVTVLKHRERTEPLIGVYSRSLADAVVPYLDDGRVMSFLKEQGYGVYESGGDEGFFLNINTPELYKKIANFGEIM